MPLSGRLKQAFCTTYLSTKSTSIVLLRQAPRKGFLHIIVSVCTHLQTVLHGRSSVQQAEVQIAAPMMCPTSGIDRERGPTTHTALLHSNLCLPSMRLVLIPLAPNTLPDSTLRFGCLVEEGNPGKYPLLGFAAKVWRVHDYI